MVKPALPGRSSTVGVHSEVPKSGVLICVL